MDKNLEDFVQGYLGCALWACTNGDGDPLDYTYGMDDISEVAVKGARETCQDFIDSNKDDLALYREHRNFESAGHDFWLTRNHHGAGFWDRGLGAVGDRLTKAAHVYGEVHLIVGDDGKLYFE